MRQNKFIPLFLLLCLLFVSQVGWSKDLSEYQLGPGDYIRVSVFQNPDFLNERRVSEMGAITLPLLGEIDLGGLSIPQAEKLIEERLKEGGFLVKPQVSITPLQIKSSQVSVIGLVNKPGRYPIEIMNLRLSEAIAMAGGIIQNIPATGLNGSETVLVTGTRNRQPYRTEIDLSQMFKSGSMEQDVVVQNGDVIYVKRADQYYIHGEVQRPGVYRLERNMTIRQALAQAGGLTQRGSFNGAKIHRKDELGHTTVIYPSLDDPVHDDDTLFLRESYF